MVTQNGFTWLAQNPRMLTLAYELNHLPSRYVHPTWLETQSKWIRHIQMRWSSESGNAHPANKHSEIALSCYLNQALELHEWWDFRLPTLRIALLDPVSLADIVWHIGLMSQATHIQKTVVHNQVVHLKKTLGEESYFFALKRAPFLGTLPLLSNPVISIAPLPAQSEALLSVDWTARITEHGQIYLLQSLQEGGVALQQRALLKLPKCHLSLSDVLHFGAQATPFHTPSWNRLIYKLIAERIPQWLPLFS